VGHPPKSTDAKTVRFVILEFRNRKFLAGFRFWVAQRFSAAIAWAIEAAIAAEVIHGCATQRQYWL